MGSKIIAAEFDIRNDVYGRRTMAKRHTDYMGRVMWTITSQPTHQRDEGAHITGLTDEQITDLYRALREQKLGAYSVECI